MSYDNTNKGTLGRNKNPKSEKSPEYSGQLNVDGKLYWVSGWVKENKSTGEKFFSLAVTPKDDAAKKSQATASNTEMSHGGQNLNDFDDEIPF